MMLRFDVLPTHCYRCVSSESHKLYNANAATSPGQMNLDNLSVFGVLSLQFTCF